jgi:hypothetical protein
MPTPLRKFLLSTQGAFLAIAAMFALWMWLTDFITFQGENTVYTVSCQGGEWQGERCTGRLAASERYRFRALRNRGEVLFWRLRSSEPSGRFTQCQVRDGRNWTCPPGADAGRTIALAVEHGRAVRDAGGRTLPFRAVQKWRWLLLDAGLYAGDTAQY